MKQKRNLIVKEKKKTKNEYRIQETPLDIFNEEDENGLSVAKHLETLKKENRELRIELEAHKKIMDAKFEKFIEETIKGLITR